MLVPVGGGSTATLASGQNMGVCSPQGIAVDGTSIYWADYGAGTVMKLAKP